MEKDRVRFDVTMSTHYTEHVMEQERLWSVTVPDKMHNIWHPVPRLIEVAWIWFGFAKIEFTPNIHAIA